MFGSIIVRAAADRVLGQWSVAGAPDPDAKSRWLSRWSKAALTVLGVRVTRTGDHPGTGLLVGNHLSYLDILVLAAQGPVTFVSKAEVARWPVMGALARMGGTVFVRRESRTDAARASDQMAAHLQEGRTIVLFPEGTSSDGERVLPFYSALLASAATLGCPVTPVSLHYTLEDGLAGEEVCYWRDMTFGPHLVNLMGKREIRAFVAYGATVPADQDRKQLARDLHRRVSLLHAAQRRQGGVCEQPFAHRAKANWGSEGPDMLLASPG